VRAPGCEGELPTQALPALKWHSEVEKEEEEGEEEEGGVQGGTTSITAPATAATAAAAVGREAAVGAGSVEVLLSGEVLEQPIVAASVAARDTVNHEANAVLEKEENAASNGRSSSTSSAIKDSTMSILEAGSRRRSRRPSQVVYNPPGGLIVQGPAAARAVLRFSGQISVDDLQQVLLSKYSPSAMQLKELFLVGSSMAPSERSKMFGNRNSDADVGAESSSAELQSRKDLLAAVQSFSAMFNNTATADATTMLLLEGFRVALLKRLVKPMAHTGAVALGAPLHAESRLGGNSFRYKPNNCSHPLR
jgi:hypothetical protein